MTFEQISICGEIASHFKVKKSIVREIATEYLQTFGEDHPVIRLELKEAGNFPLSFGISKNELELGKLLVYKTFSKSELFSDAINLLNNEDILAVAFHHYDQNKNKTLMVIRQAREYTGYAGIFVRDYASKNGYIIEQMKDFLKHEYPIYLEE